MKERYYIDACIWRDLYENRNDKFRPLGEWAFELFRMIRETRGIVLCSDLIIKELSIAFDEREIKDMFSVVEKEKLLVQVIIRKEQIHETLRIKKKRRCPFNDILHAILARDNGAIMVTRDRHFEEFCDIVDVRKPEDLI